MTKSGFPGEELRKRREEMGLSGYEAYRNTRVPVRFIDAMERGDIGSLPGACYTVGFMRTYCVFLGVEPDRFIDSYRACCRPSGTRFLRHARSEEYQAPKWINEAVTWAMVTAVLLLGWLTYTVVLHPKPHDAARRVEAAPPVVPEPPALPDDQL